ncbi:MAG: TIGR04283 family arsenosugar biosynthesis glycosyltransferase [Gammaproteobacteria bacterium]
MSVSAKERGELASVRLRRDESDVVDAPETLAIVVPVLNERVRLPQLLEALIRVQHELAHCRVLVKTVFVDGGSDDGSHEWLQERASALKGSSDMAPIGHPADARMIVCTSAAGRAIQQRQGVSQANTDFFLFLHADTVLPVNFASEWQAFRASGRCWGFFVVRLSGSAWPFRLIEWMMSWRSRLTAIATGDQAVFVSKTLYDSVGGIPDLPLMEDVVLCKRCKRFGRPWVSDYPVVTSSRRWERRGVCRTVVLMWCIRACFWLGVPARKLADWYRPKQKA